MVLLDSSSPEQFTRMPAYAGQYALMRRGLALLPTLNRLGLGRMLARPPTCRHPPPTRSRRLTSTARAARNGRDEVSMIPEVFAAGAGTHHPRRPAAGRADRLREPHDGRLGRRPGPARRSSRPTSVHRTADSTHAGLLEDRDGASRVGARHHPGRRLGPHRHAAGPGVTCRRRGRGKDTHTPAHEPSKATRRLRGYAALRALCWRSCRRSPVGRRAESCRPPRAPDELLTREPGPWTDPQSESSLRS